MEGVLARAVDEGRRALVEAIRDDVDERLHDGYERGERRACPIPHRQKNSISTLSPPRPKKKSAK